MYCGGGIMYCGGGTMYCGGGYCGAIPGCGGIIIGCCGIISSCCTGAIGARPARLKSGSNISAILFLRTALFVLFKDEVDEDGDNSPPRPTKPSSRATDVVYPPSPTSPSSAVPKILSLASLYASSRSSLVGGFPETFASPPFVSPPLIDRPAACSPLDRTRTIFFFTGDATAPTAGVSPSSPGGVGSASAASATRVVRPSSIRTRVSCSHRARDAVRSAREGRRPVDRTNDRSIVSKARARARVATCGCRERNAEFGLKNPCHHHMSDRSAVQTFIRQTDTPGYIYYTLSEHRLTPENRVSPGKREASRNASRTRRSTRRASTTTRTRPRDRWNDGVKIIPRAR